MTAGWLKAALLSTARPRNCNVVEFIPVQIHDVLVNTFKSQVKPGENLDVVFFEFFIQVFQTLGQNDPVRFSWPCSLLSKNFFETRLTENRHSCPALRMWTFFSFFFFFFTFFFFFWRCQDCLEFRNTIAHRFRQDSVLKIFWALEVTEVADEVYVFLVLWSGGRIWFEEDRDEIRQTEQLGENGVSTRYESQDGLPTDVVLCQKIHHSAHIFWCDLQT